MPRADKKRKRSESGGASSSSSSQASYPALDGNELLARWRANRASLPADFDAQLLDPTLGEEQRGDLFEQEDEEAELRQRYTPTTKPKQAPQRPEDVGLTEAMQLGGLRITEAEQAAARAPSARATAIREAAAAEAREREGGGKGGAAPAEKSGGGCCAIM